MLHNDYPGSASVSSLLRWYLFSLADHAGMRLLLADRKAREDPHAGSYLAALDFSEGAFDSALRELETQTGLFPACPEGFYNLGLVYSRLQRYEDALAAFGKAREVIGFAQTGDLAQNAGLRRFDALVTLGRFGEAVALMREFLEEYPGHPDGLRKLRKLEARPE
jgi:tetratricopeptide (TPR) repeat protein